MAELGEMYALASVGNVVSNRGAKPNIINQNNKVKKQVLNTRDIYATNNLKNVLQKYGQLSEKRYKEGQNFKETKIIPRDYKALDAASNRKHSNKVALIEEFNGSDSDSRFSDDDAKTYDSRNSRSINDNASIDSVNNNPSSMLD